MADNRLGSLVRAPTMNLNREGTNLSRVDPLKQMFRSLFELIHPSARGHVVAVIGEFLGTLVFVFLAFAGVEVAGASSNKEQGEGVSTAPPAASPSQLLYASLAAGFSLAVTAWTFFRISGGLFNPVISLGIALIGAITWARCALLCVAQTVATIAASYMVYGLFNGGLNTGTTLGGGTSPAQGVVIEMLLTAQLAFVIFMLAAEQHAATYLAPLGIGLSFFVAELVGIFWTGGSLNPVRSLAPCIVNHSFTSYHWIYWVGPISGVILAVLIYKLVKALEYESVNGEHNDSLDLLPRIIQSRKPSSVVALASTHSGYESIGAPTPKPASLRPTPQSPLSCPPPRNDMTPTKPAPTAAPNTDEKKKEKVEELPECFAD
ncbi:aquaporin-like protein [Rhexocercosporidium sp. MPI-PUGE-AT-0058]|nr:aquaporin-like protein [Rhexocercosporidium sp. MPI-PUGE-AT-0058]